MADLSKMQQDEWLEADGLGGFASGTVSGIRTRRYHALLLAATKPPAGRMVLVNGFDAVVETASARYPLSSQMYSPDTIHPDGARRLIDFQLEPWPTWLYSLEDGTKIKQEIFAVKGVALVVICWRLLTPAKSTLWVRPFFSGRDYHSLHHENPDFQFQPQTSGNFLIWHPYAGVPGIMALHNGQYRHHPEWYRNFVYQQEHARGLDFTEDLASPGSFNWDLSRNEAVWILAAEGFADRQLEHDGDAEHLARRFRDKERHRRAAFASSLERRADVYLVKRGSGYTIIAGYPWFTDWGRDTFISLRGLCMATDSQDRARDILLEWANVVAEGMLPNRFPDGSDAPEYNSVDASLWYIIAAGAYLDTAKTSRKTGSQSQRKSIQKAIDAILTGYSRGTRFGIRMDRDGLLAAGVPGVQLTWMDAKVGDWVVTPRIGKPVEVQALWVNALAIGSRFNDNWQEPYARGLESFCSRFWDAQRGHLYDNVDVDHHTGSVDPTFRPNQIFAVGGLPIALLAGDRARRVVDAVERRLCTPIGLRSLAPEEPGYAPRYEGNPARRDGIYHQGTVWPWLIGPFVEAWVRVRGNTMEAKQEARHRFLAPMMNHLDDAGLGHVSEIADADSPYMPRGCPFQAWSLAELLRLDRLVLASVNAPMPHRIALK